jgi:hypothetical protein
MANLHGHVLEHTAFHTQISYNFYRGVATILLQSYLEHPNPPMASLDHLILDLVGGAFLDGGPQTPGAQHDAHHRGLVGVVHLREERELPAHLPHHLHWGGALITPKPTRVPTPLRHRHEEKPLRHRHEEKGWP